MFLDVMWKFNFGNTRETCIEITGTENRVSTTEPPYDIIREQWVLVANELAPVAHVWFEGLDQLPIYLQMGHNKHWIRRIVFYVYEEVDWAGRYDKVRKWIQLNMANVEKVDVVNVCVHESAHCWVNANKDTIEYKKFAEAVKSHIGNKVIDYYTRTRKLQNMLKKNPDGFVNEIHSILATFKHGKTTGFAGTEALVSDEKRTPEMVNNFKTFAKYFDVLHPETPTNKAWTELI